MRVGLLGYGRVGQAVAALAGQERERLRSAGLDIQCVSALVRDLNKPRFGPAVRLSNDAACEPAAGLDVIVEVLGGLEPARSLVSRALDAGVPVVTANKTLVATYGVELRELAARRRTAFAFDAAVLAGVPFLGSLSRRPIVAAARHIAGIINGTSNFIVSAMAEGASFEGALAEATVRGYAEPDSSADVSGRDAAEKLTILLHLAGSTRTRVDDLPRTSLNVLEPADLAGARRLGGTIKPVAFASVDPSSGGAWVGPAFLPSDHPFARLDGVTNGLQLTASNGHAVTFVGPGAGPDVTAVTILDDVAEVVAGGLVRSSSLADWTPRAAASPILTSPPTAQWFVRAFARGFGDAGRGAGDQDLQPGHIAEFFAARGVPLLHLVSSGDRFVARTVRVGWLAIQDAVESLQTLGLRTLALPVLEASSGV